MTCNPFADILLLAAMLCALVGSVLQWTNHMATSPKPTQQLVQAIVGGETVKRIVADLLRSSIEQRIPEPVNQISGLRTKLKETIGTGVNITMSSPEVQSTRESTLNDSHEILPKNLTEHSSGRTRAPPSVKVNLDPLISRTQQVIRSNAGPEISIYMNQFETSAGVQAKVANVPTQQTDQVSQTLALVSYRWLFHMTAGLLLIGGLLLGMRVDRWALLAVFAAAGLGAVALICDLGEFVIFSDSGNQLAWIIEIQIIRQLSPSLLFWFSLLWYGHLSLMVVGLMVAVAKGVRKPA